MFNVRGMKQSLKNNAVLLRLLSQRAELLGCDLGAANTEQEADALKSNWDFFREAERALKVKIALDAYADFFSRNSHGGGDHLAGDLGAGGQGAKQQVSGASGSAGATHPLVGFGAVN